MNTFSKFFSAISVVMGFVFVSCTDEGMTVNMPKSTPSVDTTVVIVKENLSVKNDLEHNISSDDSYACDYMTATATVNLLHDGEVVATDTYRKYPEMESGIRVEKNNYNITEDDVDCTVTGSTITRYQSTESVSADGVENADTVYFSLSDGQEVILPTRVTMFSFSYDDDTEINFGSVRLSDARMVSIENEDIMPTTRASYVANSLRTNYTVELTYKEENIGRDSSYVVVLKASAIRNIIAEDEIASVTATDKNRVVIDNETEKVSFVEVITMKSGEIIRNEKSFFLSRLFKGIDSYDKYVSSFNFNLLDVNGISNGAESQIKSNEGWTVFGRTDKYSANVGNDNSADAFSTDYSLYHERCVYQDENITVEFGYETVNVAEYSGNTETVTTDKEGYDKAVYMNEISTSYIGYTQNLSEYVNLYKIAKAVSDYDFRNGMLTVNNGSVVAELDFITIYNTGEEVSEHISKTFARSLKCTSSWTSFEENAEQTTGSASVSLNSGNKTDGYWSYVNETRTIKTVAKLAGSNQTNSWESIDPNKIVYTRQGKTYEFGTVDFSAVEDGASVSIKNEDDENIVYNYTDKIVVTFGNNSQSSNANGIITVAKEIVGDFPVEWGKFVSAVCTVSYNESKSGWCYAWSIHFEKGTLPVIVDKNATGANIDQSLFEYDTCSRLNGAIYKNGAWHNAIASDEANYMLWRSSEDTAMGNLVYPTATAWNWNNGKNSVFTDVFSFSVENSGRKLTVQKDGKVFASYLASAR